MKKILVMRFLRGFMLIVMLSVLCLSTANADFGWEQIVERFEIGNVSNIRQITNILPDQLP